jgi:adenylosuccinate synthase
MSPVYKAFDGWSSDTTQIKEAAKLPKNMSSYIDFINKYIGAPVKYVSNGPGREQIVKL